MPFSPEFQLRYLIILFACKLYRQSHVPGSQERTQYIRSCKHAMHVILREDIFTWNSLKEGVTVDYLQIKHKIKLIHVVFNSHS